MTIRVYDVDEESSASSRTGTSGADGIADDDQSDFDVENSSPIDLLIEEHKQAFMRFLAANSTIHQPRMDSASSNLRTILKPSASSIKYPVMHPLSCRHMHPIINLDHFAKLTNSLPNWESLFHEAWDADCMELFEAFVNLPVDTVEAMVHVVFNHIVILLSKNLSIKTMAVDQSKVRIGGLTSLPEYDYASVTDVKFIGVSTNQTLFGTEIKTAASWKPRESWYRDSRLSQALASLYGHGAPTFLFTQNQYKVFCENDERNTIYTFPFDTDPNESEDTNSFMCYKMNEMFFQAVAICLLREPRTTASSRPKQRIIEVVPLKPTAKDSPLKKQTLAKKKATELKQATKAPSFITGFKGDGAPIYQTIAIWNVDNDEEEMGSCTTLVDV
jgi:hypothetical protein